MHALAKVAGDLAEPAFFGAQLVDHAWCCRVRSAYFPAGSRCLAGSGSGRAGPCSCGAGGGDGPARQE